MSAVPSAFQDILCDWPYPPEPVWQVALQLTKDMPDLWACRPYECERDGDAIVWSLIYDHHGRDRRDVEVKQLGDAAYLLADSGFYRHDNPPTEIVVEGPWPPGSGDR